MRYIKEKTLQEWIPIKKIHEEGVIELKNGNLIKIIGVSPINFNLKSSLEKESILNSYKIFLKTCNFNIQILIQSNKEDLSNHISNIKNIINKKENKYLEKFSENYIEYINSINTKRKSSSKKFFIIISSKDNNKNKYIKSDELIKNDLKEKYFKIKECLSRLGNSVEEIKNKNEIEEIIYSFLNIKNKIIN